MDITNERLNAILLLDDNSRKSINLNLATLSDLKIIYSLDELNEELCSKYSCVLILEGFIMYESSLSDLRLYKRVYNTNFKYISSTETYLRTMSQFCECYNIGLSSLTRDALFGVIYNDTSILPETATYDDTLNSLCESISNDSKYSETVRSIAQYSTSLKNLVDFKDKEIKSLTEYNSILSNKCAILESSEANIIQSVKEIYIKCRNLNTNLVQYENILSQDIYKQVASYGYPDKPFIVYFKEYEELIHFHTFIDTLFNSIKGQLRLSCKVLLLFNGDKNPRIQTLPKHYKLLRGNIGHSNTDVFANDFLAKYGDYTALLDLLLQNKLNTDVLLLFDCKPQNDSVLIGQDLYYSLCRNEKHISPLGLNPVNTIVNNSKSADSLSWNTINFDDYTGETRQKDIFYKLSTSRSISDIVSSIDVRLGDI